MHYFDKIPSVSTRNSKGYLAPTLKNTLNLLISFADHRTHKVQICLRDLAEYSRRSVRTMSTHISKLVKLGKITRKINKSRTSNVMNLPSVYTILEWAEPVPPSGNNPSTNNAKTSWGDEENFVEKIQESSRVKVNTKTTLTRDTPTEGTPNGGAEAPVETVAEGIVALPTHVSGADKVGEKQNPKPCQTRCDLGENLNPKEPGMRDEAVETPNPQTPELGNAKGNDYPDDIMRVDLTGVPDLFVPTARYWCFRTGRRVLTEKEVAALQWCDETQMPTYVNKSIDKAIATWEKQGKLVCQQHFTYIKAMLEHQRSYDPAKKGRKRNKKAAQSEVHVQPVEKPVVELAMPLEAAERVIAEYKPVSRPTEELPAALSELFDGIKAKDIEVTEARFAALPKDADGFEILPEDEAELEALHRGLDLPDYLRLKFPNAPDAELSTDKLSAGDVAMLTTAMEIDKACAYCENADECRLSAGSQAGRGRPVAVLSNGRVSAGRSQCLMCKHTCAVSKPDPDFERRVKECGLTEIQAKRDFASYSHESPEVVVAKARAILAAQNGTNLVLAGNIGAGKTHLSTAIALEAIRSGRKAIVANVPAMLEEICYAAQNHGDVHGLLMKYKSVDCLVLDDWGKERRSDARMDYMYQIIDYRYERGLQTIVTTNEITPDGLKDRFYGDRIEPLVSRILSNGEWITIQDAADYRLKPKEAATSVVTAVEPVQTVPVAEPEQTALSSEPVQENPAVESGASPSSAEHGEASAEIATQSDEDSVFCDVVACARAVSPVSPPKESHPPASVNEDIDEDDPGLFGDEIDRMAMECQRELAEELLGFDYLKPQPANRSPAPSSSETEQYVPPTVTLDAMIAEPPAERPAESDEKGAAGGVSGVTRVNPATDKPPTPEPVSESEVTEAAEPAEPEGYFDWESGEAYGSEAESLEAKYDEEYLASWEAEVRELEELSKEKPDLPDEDERRWSS